jgi:hypothetical protein
MSIVAQPAMQEQLIPLCLIADSMSERMQLARSLNAATSLGDVGQFAQVDADVNALLESWATRLAMAGGVNGDVWFGDTA